MTQTGIVCARGARAQSGTDFTAPGGVRELAALSRQFRHELRTPLNAVLGFAEVMRREMFGPVGNDRYREYLDHISESAQRVLAAADNALTVTSALADRRRTHRKRPTDLDAAVRRAIQSTEPEHHGFSVEVTQSGSPNLSVWSDQEALDELLVHLLGVAAQYAGVDDRVLIDVADDDATATFTLTVLREDDAAPSEDRRRADAEFKSSLAALQFHCADGNLWFEDEDVRGWSCRMIFDRSLQHELPLG
ncbi:MAG: sensor histidine kinase [Hyphomicrobiaceae bacterium]